MRDDSTPGAGSASAGKSGEGAVTGAPSRAVRLTANGDSLTVHPLRDRVVNELHARPFDAVETPRRIYHLAYVTDGDGASADRAAVVAFCQSHGVTPPDPDAKHHRVRIGAVRMRWEQHSEFTTYSWESSADPLPAFQKPVLSDVPLKDMPPPPGPVIAAIHLSLVPEDQAPAYDAVFDPANICVAVVHGGVGHAVTDFRQDPHGYTRILIVDKGMRPERAGAVVQRVLEIETYRTLALLGLPEVERIRPMIGRIEKELSDWSIGPKGDTLENNREQLERLIDLATEVESIVAGSDYRFSATRAYDAIVDQRLQSIREESLGGYSRWSSFLARRMKPAIATCETTKIRLDKLSTKLARASDLLRTQVDIDIEQQNRDLLRSMDQRARLQLRLQQTVEGLSVAAVSYYIVGLVGYILAGGEAFSIAYSPGIATALAVPPVVLFVWWTVRRIRRRHDEQDRKRGED